MPDRLYAATATPPTPRAFSRPVVVGLILGGALVIGCSVRWLARDFVSDDWETFLKFWQRFLIAFDGFPALRYAFSNYSAPYTYLLAIVTQVLGGLPPLYQIKLVSVLFDVALALLAYRFVAFYRTGTIWPAVGFALVFLAPTVILNSAAWAQADAIFTTFLLAALLALCHQRFSLAMVLYAVALSFKLQAGFLLPLFIFLALARSLPWRTFVLLPVVYALVNVPALLMGRPLTDAFLVYGAQIDRYDDLTLKAPNLFQWLPSDPRALLQWIGFGLAGAFVLILLFTSRKNNAPIANRQLQIALALLIGLPFFLPRMHDRYFYPADVLSIICALAFFPPPLKGRGWGWGWIAIALAVNAASLAAYIAYLWEGDPVIPKLPLWLAALFMFAALIGITNILIRHSRESGNPVAESASSVASPVNLHAHHVWMPAYAGMTILTIAVVVVAALIGANVRTANDRALHAATLERNGYGVQLHRARAMQCANIVRIDLAWVGSTLRRAPRTETYSVFVHVYDALGQRIAVADGYVDGAFPLNDVEFDLSEVRTVMLDEAQSATEIRVGVYAVEPLGRLRTLKPDGAPWDANEVVIPVQPCTPRQF